jgi:hypothetical protein
LNFKRRSKAASLDTNAGNEASDKPKRRKLVRPSFGQSDNTASSGKELQENAIVETETVGNKLQKNAIVETETVGNRLQENVIMEMSHTPVETVGNKLQENVVMEMTHTPVETDGNKFFIDLNEPASVDSDLMEDGSVVPPPDVFVKKQIEKPCEVDTNKPSCINSDEVISKQDRPSESGAPSEKITLDLSVTDLDTMDEAKLQAILGSSLLQALDKLRNGKSNDSEKAKLGLCGKNGVVKMETKCDPGTNGRCS